MATSKDVLATMGALKRQYLLGSERRKDIPAGQISAYKKRPYLQENDIRTNPKVRESNPWGVCVLRKDGIASIMAVDFWENDVRMLGPLVKILATKKKGNVLVYIENIKRNGWLSFEKEADAFSVTDVEDMDGFEDELSTASLGFYPESYLVGKKLTSQDLITGSIVLRASWEKLLESKQDIIDLCYTWDCDRSIPLKSSLQIDSLLAFGSDRADFPKKISGLLKANSNQKRKATEDGENKDRSEKKGQIEEEKPKCKNLLENGPREPLPDQTEAENTVDLASIAAGAIFSHDELESKYVLPLDQFVEIPIEQMRRPGHDFKSRPFDTAHAEEIRNLMIENPLQMPQMADVVPILKVDSDTKNKQTLVQMKGMDLDAIYEMIPKCYFITISGQHSSAVMLWITRDAVNEQDKTVKGVAERCKVRQCRIISASLTTPEYITLGKMSNPKPGEKMYDTPFVQKVEHIRGLYHYAKCPPRFRPGKPKSEEFIAWEEESKLILGGSKDHTPFQNVQWAIFAHPKVFNGWLEICHGYIKGKLPGSDGEVQTVKKDRIVHSGFFKHLEGDFPESKILSIFKDVKDHKVLVTKTTGKAAKSIDKESINEVARKYKDRAFSQKVFLCKLKHNFLESTADLQNWADLDRKCPKIERSFEVLQSLLDQELVKNKHKTPSHDMVPDICAAMLRKLWMEVEPSAVCNAVENHPPYHVLFVKEKESCEATVPAPRLSYAACQLAIVDFTAKDEMPWSLAAVASLVRTIHSIFSNGRLQFIFILSPSNYVTMTSVHQYLFKPPAENVYRMVFDHGSFYPHEPSVTATEGVFYAPIQIIRALLYTDEDANRIATLPGRTKYNFKYNKEQDKEIQQDFDMKLVQRELESQNRDDVLSGGIEKSPLQIRHEILFVYPPHSTMCGIPFTRKLGVLIPKRIAKQIILNNSSEKDIIVDCFSGGWVSREALLNNRECAAFTCSKPEVEFLNNFLAYFKDIGSAKEIFRSSTSRAILTTAAPVNQHSTGSDEDNQESLQENNSSSSSKDLVVDDEGGSDRGADSGDEVLDGSNDDADLVRTNIVTTRNVEEASPMPANQESEARASPSNGTITAAGAGVEVQKLNRTNQSPEQTSSFLPGKLCAEDKMTMSKSRNCSDDSIPTEIVDASALGIDTYSCTNK